VNPVKHPGTITIVDETAGTEKQVRASDVPESVAFIGDVPVVRVVSRTRDDGARDVMSYGADGALLQSTLMR
jgi:hypothetical protein